MIELKQDKKFKNDMSKVTFSDSQFNKYINYSHLLANEVELHIEAKNPHSNSSQRDSLRKNKANINTMAL